MVDKSKEDMKFGVPDGKAQSRLEQSLAIAVIEHFFKDSSPTLSLPLVGTLLGGSYLNVYYKVTSASHFSTVEEHAYRTLFSERLMSDLNSVLKTLQDGPLSFALTGMLNGVKELGKEEAKHRKEAAVMAKEGGKGCSQYPCVEACGIPERQVHQRQSHSGGSRRAFQGSSGKP